MKCRGSLHLSVCLALLLGCHGTERDADPAIAPNIIFLLTDDQRWDMLGAAGNETLQTPNLDSLAERGVLFENAYATTSICSVSRASILSGQYGRRHQIWGLLRAFSAEAFSQTYPMLLKAAGYYTGYIGKYGVGSTELPARKFDYWGGFERQGSYFQRDEPGARVHLTAKIGRQALEFLRSRDERKPFLLSIGFKAPHVDDRAPPVPEKMFASDPRYADEYEDVVWDRPAAAAERYFDHFPPAFTRRNEARIRWRQRFSTPERYDASLEGYYRLVHGVDVVVGELLHELERQGIADDTVILFSSDNGFYLGEYGFAGKWYGSEPSVRVPLVLFDPRDGGPRGMRVSEIALNIDIAPTILSIAGVARPAAMQGEDLTRLVSGEAESWRTDFFYENLWPPTARPHIPSTEGVIGERYKYMRYFSLRKPGEIIFEEMYDLNHDPDELSNLIDDRDSQETRTRLAKAVQAFSGELE